MTMLATKTSERLEVNICTPYRAKPSGETDVKQVDLFWSYFNTMYLFAEVNL